MPDLLKTYLDSDKFYRNLLKNPKSSKKERRT